MAARRSKLDIPDILTPMAKVLVSIEEKLLKRIDRTARERGLSRSAYLAELAERDLADRVGPGADPEVKAAIADLKQLFRENPTWGDSTTIIRAMRDSR
jgi:hypothetical protein